MATAGPSAPAAYPDPSRPGKFSIRLAEDLLEDRKPDLRYFTTRLNYKPKAPSSQRRISKSSSPSSNDASAPFHLTIEHEDDKYNYDGHVSSASQEDGYVLVFQPETRDFLLRRVDAEYDFNLVRASTDSELPKKHRHIPGDHTDGTRKGKRDDLEREVEDDLFENNPFDFHQYVDNIPQSNPAVATLKSASRPGSNVGSPLVVPSRAAPTRPSPAKPKTARAAAAPKTAPGRSIKEHAASKAKAVLDVNNAATKSHSDRVKQQDIPTVHLERRASTRLAVGSGDTFGDDAEDDFAMLDAERSPSPDKARHTAFRGTPKGMGPMSLSQLVRSASPSSAGLSPNKRTQQESGDEFELGDGLDEEEEDDDDDDDDKEDGDVNSIALGSPVTRPEATASKPAAEEDAEAEADADDDEFDELNFDELIETELQGMDQSEQIEAAEDHLTAGTAIGEDDEESEEE